MTNHLHVKAPAANDEQKCPKATAEWITAFDAAIQGLAQIAAQSQAIGSTGEDGEEEHLRALLCIAPKQCVCAHAEAVTDRAKLGGRRLVAIDLPCGHSSAAEANRNPKLLLRQTGSAPSLGQPVAKGRGV